MPIDEQLRERENRLLLSLVARKRTLMTDEQRMREQFEAWANKQVLWQHFDVGIDWTGVQYDDMELDLAWDAFRAGQQARDAEVQALREELLNYVSADEMAVGEGYGTYPKSEHRRIRSVLAGEEANDDNAG